MSATGLADSHLDPGQRTEVLVARDTADIYHNGNHGTYPDKAPLSWQTQIQRPMEYPGFIRSKTANNIKWRPGVSEGHTYPGRHLLGAGGCEISML